MSIQTNKVDLIGQKYHIIIVNMLKNRSGNYSNHYIIEFIDFMLIYYTINLDIIFSFMIFNNLYTRFINLLQI